MPSTLAEIAQQISDAIQEARDSGEPLKESDPEIWDHLYDEVFFDLEKYEANSTAGETEIFRRIYQDMKKIIDEALIPSDLQEALYSFEEMIGDVLYAIAEKNPETGAQIFKDMRSVYSKNKDEAIHEIAKEIADRIEEILPPELLQTANTPQGPLDGKTIVFTGALASMTRAEATKLATEMGATVTGSISKKTDFLVAGEDAGSKRAKAEGLGISILSEEEWNAMTARGESKTLPETKWLRRIEDEKDPANVNDDRITR